ncbi:MAG: hypothetical protein ACOCXM_01500 [Myxococcota bacterium]
MGSRKKRHDPTYAALASGPGSFERAMEAALDRPPPSEPARAPSPASAASRMNTAPSSRRPDVPTWDVEQVEPLPPSDASRAYCRVLEELSTYVVPAVGHRLLMECLAEEDSSAESAIPYDLRAILVDALPRRLRRVLSADRAAAAVEALEQALMNMHAPPSAPRPRGASKDEAPYASSVPPA